MGINDTITQSIPTDQGLFLDHTNIIKFEVKTIKPLPKHNPIKKINKHNKRKGTNFIKTNDIKVPKYDETENAMPTVPKWGGNISTSTKRGNKIIQNDFIRFINTCNIDNWLAFLSLNKDLCKSIIPELNEDETLKHFLKTCEDRKFNVAKFLLAGLNKLKINNKCIKFYGNEEVYFITHFKAIFTSNNNFK